jgi:hypothetical protein
MTKQTGDARSNLIQDHDEEREVRLDQMLKHHQNRKAIAKAKQAKATLTPTTEAPTKAVD